MGTAPVLSQAWPLPHCGIFPCSPAGCTSNPSQQARACLFFPSVSYQEHYSQSLLAVNMSSLQHSGACEMQFLPNARGTQAAPGSPSSPRRGCLLGLARSPAGRQRSALLCDNTLLGGFCVLCSTCLQPEMVTNPWGCQTDLGSVPKLALPALTQVSSKELLVLLGPRVSWKGGVFSVIPGRWSQGNGLGDYKRREDIGSSLSHHQLLFQEQSWGSHLQLPRGLRSCQNH